MLQKLIKGGWKSGDLPAVVTQLSKFQVFDGAVVPREHARLGIPVSSAGMQYAKRSRLGGQRLYLTDDSSSLWLCFPFSTMHARFVANNDVDYHTRMNLSRVLRGEPHPEYLSPAQVLELLFRDSDFPFAMEVFDTQTCKKRRYTKADFLADMLRGPAANLADTSVQDCPNYLRPFFTGMGSDAFALVAPPSETSEHLVFALNRPWPVWVNPTNFLGVTVFLPVGGKHAVGMPLQGLNRGEVRKGTCNYAATREQLVDTKDLILVDMKSRGVFDHNSGEQLQFAPFHDMMMPYVTGGETHYAETISSNVFVVVEEASKRVLLTPSAEEGNYPGITRFFVLQFANDVLLPLGLVDEVREAPLTRELLLSGKVKEMFRTGSASGVNFINALVWYDVASERYNRLELGKEFGEVAAVVSEAFELVARGYELVLKSPDPRAKLSALNRFSEMCVRLEVPEEKVASAMPTFSPSCVKDFDPHLVLEGVGKATRMFEKRAAFATAHDRKQLKELARSRY